MKTIALVGLVGLILSTVRDIVMARLNQSVGSNVHKETLKRILLAPVNNFFDVTPIGKILNIFTSNMNVFYGELFDPIDCMINMTSHMLVILIFLFTTCNTYILLPVFGLMFLQMRRIMRPYLNVEN